MKKTACLSCLILALIAAPWTAATAESNVLFIYDASGSMKKKLDSGETRMDAAKKAMVDALGTMPADVRLGLLLYGHRKAKDCTDIELVSPIGADDAKTIAKRITSLEAKGETPIAESLRQAVRSYAALKGQDNRIVLVTDGVEECGGDVCAVAKEVRDAGFDLKVDIVGFTLSDKQKSLIQCVPEITGGKYYDAQNLAGLNTVLTQVTQKAIEPPVDTSLIAQKNGGKLLAAPSDEWLKLNDGAADKVTTYFGEAVWSFKDGKPATFDNFEVLIPEAYSYNMKDFELLVGDDGPLGTFRSIGNFSAQNIKMMQSPYQKFTFAPVTARYLKIVIKSSYSDYAVAYEFRVQGTVDESAEPAPAAAATPPDAIDLISGKNGGTLVSAPSDEWLKLNDGAADKVTTYFGEGVWGFKDGKPATFDTFEVLIPFLYSYNMKDFELLVGDDGPLGTFRSIGVFATHNFKLFESPYQRFTFAPVTARYLKVVIKGSYSDYAVAYEFRLPGKLDESAAPPPAATATPADVIDLLSSKNGGTLIAAPGDKWSTLNNGAGEKAVTYFGEGIWGFKEGKPATFDSFEVLIPFEYSYNMKDFELLAGDDGPLGTFRSIGNFSTQNMKMMQSPYQKFTFAPVTARYLKVAIKSSYGGYAVAYEFRLQGKIDESAAPAAAPAANTGINVLAQSNGGALLAGTNDAWQKFNDGSEDRAATSDGSEGIWAFKDEKPVTFDAFEVLIPFAESYNLKDFELLAAADSPTGPFVSIGQFTAHNMKMMQSPYQRFSFAPVTARYLKVVLKSNQGGGYIAAYEFRLLGKPAP